MERLEARRRSPSGKLNRLRSDLAFKHGLVLRGLGGQTVKELDRNLLQSELEDWKQYFVEAPHEWDRSGRLERLIARIAAAWFGAEPADFLEMPESERVTAGNQSFVEIVQANNARMMGVDDGC